jgi:hypothetical protein
MVTMGREKWGEAQVRHWVGNGVPKLVEKFLPTTHKWLCNAMWLYWQ